MQQNIKLKTILLYLAILSMLIVPVHGFALDLATDHADPTQAPCHTEQETSHDCCDDVTSGCSHCFVSVLALYSIHMGLTIPKYIAPYSWTDLLAQQPPDNLFRPPRLFS